MKQTRRAEINDIPAILAIMQQNLMANKKTLSREELEQHGFLKNGFSFEEAAKAVLDVQDYIVLVAMDMNVIVGYIIGCDVTKLKPSFQEILANTSAVIKDVVYAKKSIYLRHIAKQAGALRIGPLLLQALLAEARQQEYQYILSQIMLEPFENKPSVAFHEKNGFAQNGFHLYNDEKWGVFSRLI